MSPSHQRSASLRNVPPVSRPLKHDWYSWDTDMTVCIAASSIFNNDPLIVLCADMMGSTDWSSSERTPKWRPVGTNFYALLSGPISNARELVASCHRSFSMPDAPQRTTDVLSIIRRAIGYYKEGFAEAHIQGRLGISYQEFRLRGKSELPDELYRDLLSEIRNHYSDAELIITGFIDGKPNIFKVSGDSVWSCDSFAVIGSGTLIAEASLFHRQQSFMNGRDRTLYCVFEAKRLAEKAPGVGKVTQIFVVRPDHTLEMVQGEGFNVLEKYLTELSPKEVQYIEPIPMTTQVMPVMTPYLESTRRDPTIPPPLPESPEGSDES